MHAYCMSIIMGLACLRRRCKSMENNHITSPIANAFLSAPLEKTNSRHLYAQRCLVVRWRLTRRAYTFITSYEHKFT